MNYNNLDQVQDDFDKSLDKKKEREALLRKKNIKQRYTRYLVKLLASNNWVDIDFKRQKRIKKLKGRKV